MSTITEKIETNPATLAYMHTVRDAVVAVLLKSGNEKGPATDLANLWVTRFLNDGEIFAYGMIQMLAGRETAAQLRELRDEVTR